jgi:hypothetical protein
MPVLTDFVAWGYFLEKFRRGIERTRQQEAERTREPKMPVNFMPWCLIRIQCSGAVIGW